MKKARLELSKRAFCSACSDRVELEDAMSEQTKQWAKKLANWYARTGDETAQAGIYADGVVFYLVASPRRQWDVSERLTIPEQLMELLGGATVATARSDDDFCGTVVVLGSLPVTVWAMQMVGEFLRSSTPPETLVFSDNRQEDVNTIATFVNFIEVPEEDVFIQRTTRE
jgi:hypothetical protein